MGAAGDRSGSIAIQRSWDPLNPLLQVGDLWIGDKRDQSNVMVNGDDDHVHVHDGDHDGSNRAVVKGTNDHVHYERSTGSAYTKVRK